MEPNPFSSHVGARVLVAFDGDASRWRTLGGIARKADLTIPDVADFIEKNQHCFIQSSVKPGGMALYGIRHDLSQRAHEGASGHQGDRAAV